MTQFAVSIFLSAFLLFQVQPMIGKFILPWFGGTPAVWSTAMLFFQLFLTGGYAYAYWLVKQKRQGWIHVSLLAVTLALLTAFGLGWSSPVMPSADWKPTVGMEMPILQLFLILTISVGLPYFVLAANSPLMQVWFSSFFPERSYARLYSLSNIGSLLGLLAYPLVIEPWLTLRAQGWVWSGGFLVFSILVGWIGINAQGKQRVVAAAVFSGEYAKKPTIAMMGLWAFLGAVASIFLLAVTNQMTQEVAVIPFLWILPLALYLLSFILTFSDGPWIQRRLYALLFALVSLVILYMLLNAGTLEIYFQIAAYSVLLFLACMVAHGELYLLRPSSTYLTTFYLMVSVGGALGGIFVNLVAPLIFTGYWEFYLAWFLTVIVIILSLLPRLTRPVTRSTIMWSSFVLALVAIVYGLNPNSDDLVAVRNFFGVIRIKEVRSADTVNGYLMVHGATVHGFQYAAPDLHMQPTAYYSKNSGIGIVLLNHPKYGNGMRVGVLGLGIGVLAAYGQDGDIYRFYEINPVVVEFAEGKGGYFSFLSDSNANVTVITDDARLALERELMQGQVQNFDVLVLDTFSSDAIPMHLITKEAFALYLAHLNPDGILAVHISNRHIDLRPVLRGLAEEFGLVAMVVDTPSDSDIGAYQSRYVLLSSNSESLQIPELQTLAVPLDDSFGTVRLWTDDYSNLFQIVR